MLKGSTIAAWSKILNLTCCISWLKLHFDLRFLVYMKREVHCIVRMWNKELFIDVLYVLSFYQMHRMFSSTASRNCCSGYSWMYSAKKKTKNHRLSYYKNNEESFQNKYHLTESFPISLDHCRAFTVHVPVHHYYWNDNVAIAELNTSKLYRNYRRLSADLGQDLSSDIAIRIRSKLFLSWMSNLSGATRGSNYR